MTSPTVRSTMDGSRNARSSRPFSVIEPTKPSSASPSGLLRDRELADAVLLERRDRLPDPLRSSSRATRSAAVRRDAGRAAGPGPDDGARGGEQAVGAHPLVVVDLGQVAPAAVGQEDDDHGVAPVRSSRRARRTTSRAATIAVPHEPPDRIPSSRVMPPGHGEGVAVADADPAIDDRRVVGAREEVLADALGQVGPGGVAGQDAALGIGPDHLDRRVACLERAGGAGDRPARPDAGDEMGDPALGLVPQLRAGRPLVGGRVLRRSSTGRA